VPAGAALTTLKAAARQGGIEIIFLTQFVEGVKTNPVSGALTPREAIDRMLAGTLLSVVEDTKTGALAVRRIGDPEKNVEQAVVKPARPKNDAATGRTTTAPVTLEEFKISAAIVRSYKSDRVQVGTFRDMNPVDVPLTINAVNREVMDAQGAEGLFAALKNVAGVTRSQQSGATFDNLAVRGVALANRDNFRLNGSLPIINLIQFPLEDIDRVEVLKGVGALYYGFVATGGMVNYITKRPAMRPVNMFTFAANEYGGYGGSVDISRRVERANGYFGVRVNAGAGQEKYGINKFVGERNFVALAADWRVGDRLLFRFDFAHVKKDATDVTTYAVPVTSGALVIPPVPSNKLNLGAAWMINNTFADNALLRTDVILSRSWTLVLEGGVANTQRDRINSSFAIRNVITGDGTLTVPFARNLNYRNENARAELFGRFTMGPVSHNLSVGITGNSRNQDSPPPPSLTFNQNLYYPVDIPQTYLVAVPIVHAYNYIVDKGTYFSDRLGFDQDRWQLIVSGRYSSFRNRVGATLPPPTVYHKDTFSPAASVVFKPSATSSVYASYLEGMEQGNTAAATLANAGEALPPLHSKQEEIGCKVELLDNALLQLAFFQMDRPSSFVDPSTNRLTANGLSRTKGLEVALSGEIVKQLSAIASATFLSNEQLNKASAATYGKRTENTPPVTLSGFVEWRVPMIKDLALSAGAYYVGPRQVNNNGQGQLAGYTTYSGGISYRFAIGATKYVARLSGDNLSDKNAWGSVGQGFFTPTLPRLVKLTVQVSY